ncbi:MAG: FliO/MopB family protein [Hyphomicrobiales bacterium]|nr:FliO/MopB family protein [Hyphomicrobiales bacterium]
MDLVTGVFIDSFPASVKLIIVALILVAILALAVWVMRWFFNRVAKSNNQNTASRLVIVSATNIDSHRRLVLIRRDDVEHLVMIGGASDVLIESNIDNAFHSPMAYQQTAQEDSSTLEQYPEDPILQVSEFDDIFSPTDTAELTKETPGQPQVANSWRDKAGIATVLATASQDTDQSDDGAVSSQTSTVSATHQAEEDTFSRLASVLDAELAKSPNFAEETQDTIPPSLSSPDASIEADGSHNNDHNETAESPAPPDKHAMEDEMQRLLNELTGEKT